MTTARKGALSALLDLLRQDSRSELRPWHGHVVAAALVGAGHPY